MSRINLDLEIFKRVDLYFVSLTLSEIRQILLIQLSKSLLCWLGPRASRIDSSHERFKAESIFERFKSIPGNKSSLSLLVSSCVEDCSFKLSGKFHEFLAIDFSFVKQTLC